MGDIIGFGDNRVHINADGAVAFYAKLKSGESSVYVAKGGILTELMDTSGLFSGFYESPAINNAGEVAFLASLDTGGQGVFVGHPNGGLTTIADTTGSFDYFVSAANNNRGDVAFLAGAGGAGSGIFTGGDVITDKVIRNGDTLLGSTVLQLGGVGGVSRIAFNERGCIYCDALERD
jgi:hypothetical protein